MKRIIFDVGANNGSDSIDLAKSDNNTIVYAFEPTPYLINILKEITKDLDNYNIIEKAVSNYNGKSEFNVAGQADWGCSSLLKFSDKSKTEWVGRDDFKVTETIEVEVIKLEDFIISNNIEYIDHLHVDTQGSDLNVLLGMGEKINIIKRGRIEAASKKDILYEGQNYLDDCLEFLKNNNFKIINITSNDVHNNEVNIEFNKR
jgi:FkbM family methyltransferase